MTARDKAEELFNRFYSAGEINSDTAKRCAIVCADETIEAIMFVIGSVRYMWSEHQSQVIAHWQEVKRELDKL